MQVFKSFFFHEDKSLRWQFRYLFFVFIFISLFVSEIDPVIGNDIILFLELIFIFSYRNLGLKSNLLSSYQNNRFLFVLFALWIVGAFISLIFSPILNSLLAFLAQVPRFVGSIINIVFAYVLFDAIRAKRLSPWMPFFVIVGGALITGLNYLLVWNLYPKTHIEPAYLLNPPFYVNIRQAGFHANVAVCVLVGFLFRNDLKINTKVLVYLLLTSMWTYLFWTGGRASALSALFAVYFLLFVLFILKQKVRDFFLWITLSIVLGILLSEYLTVLPVNGLLSIFDRNVSGGANAISSGRVDIWRECILALEHHWTFGLGAESYLFLRDASGELLFSTQPHSVIFQFLIEWGVVGLLLASTFLCVLFYKAFNVFIANINDVFTPIRLVGLLTIISFSITGLVDGTFYHAQPVMCLVLSFVVCLLPSEPLDKNKEHAFNFLNRN